MPRRFDTVVVGAGAAGCVVASRLSEDPRHNVLLLDAGSLEPMRAGATPSFMADLADPARHGDVMAQRIAEGPLLPYPQGRGLGGTSLINGMVMTPGLPEDYDRWSRDLGCFSWDWASVAPWFDRVAVPREAPPRSLWGPVDTALVESATAAGHEEVGAAPLSLRDGRRMSAADAYIVPHRTRRNLTMWGESPVRRVLIERRGAVGVELMGGRVIEGAEVVLCAGAIHSPAILMRTGVERAGLGNGLRDHPTARVTLGLHRKARNNGLTAATLLRWSSGAASDDLQVLPLNHVEDRSFGALVIGLMQARSTGSVALVKDEPVVHLGLLRDEEDRARLRAAVRHVATLLEHPTWRAIVTGVFIDRHGTPLSSLPADDTALDRWLLEQTGDHAHVAGTCRMGRVADANSVVDVMAKVHGYDRLRVCDASVMPDLPRANPYWPVLMIAERVAWLIQQQPAA